MRLMNIRRSRPKSHGILRVAVAVAASALVITVCGVPSAQADEYAATAVISGPATGLEYPAGIATDAGGLIYVSSQGTTNTVSVFAPSAAGNTAPLRTIQFAAGVQPFCLDTDSHGSLYVCLSNGKVATYAPGASGLATPTSELDMPAGGYQPWGLALDAQDRIYVGSNNTFNSRIDRYAAAASGAATPTLSITGIGFSRHPSGLDVDQSGNIYAILYDNGGNGACDFVVYPANTTTASRTFIAPYGWDIELDGSGFAYVSQVAPQGSIAVYEAGTSSALASTPVRTITIPGMTDPNPLVMAADGRLLVVDFTGTAVYVLDVTSGTGEEPPPIPPILQQVGMPSTMNCADVDDSELNWADVRSGGWNPSWAQWAHDGTGGPVCGRWLTHVSATGHWRSS